MRVLKSTFILFVWGSPTAWSFVTSSNLSTGGNKPSFSPPLRAESRSNGENNNVNDAAIPTNQVVQRVAVAGATGKTGRLVVQELLDRQVETVVGLVRSTDKAQEVFGLTTPTNLKLIQCDLTNEKAVQAALQDVDAAIWCATGFSSSATWVERLQQLFGLTIKQEPLDTVGVPLLARSLPKKASNYPRMVMCSSAGVSRPQWSDKKKERLVGAADIPIVRLNPFGILDIKLASEDKLRYQDKNTPPYCIVRPSGLNDDWPEGSRPIISQGDVAVGRICRADVAKLLVDVLSIPEAVGKTFEVTAVADYPPPRSLRPVLRRLVPDTAAIDEVAVEATYHVLQQLLPGEKQAANELAMGQTYEQLDRDETGRLGPRGEEKVQEAGIQPTMNGASAQ
jgi:uncharacterized protein YbjT (DUF2867 family)